MPFVSWLALNPQGIADNERNTRLGEYRDGKTYLASGTLFGYGNLLSALIVNDAKRRGVWS